MSSAEELPIPENEFVAYVGDPDIHDGRVERVEPKGDTVRVIVRGASGRRLAIDFAGVAEVRSQNPEGMVLYSLSEMRAPAPLRRFDFVNWYDKERDKAYLVVVAKDFKVSRLDG